MENIFFSQPDIKDVLANHDLSKFGDAIVNFIYNAAVYRVKNVLQGVKVWDQSLAQVSRETSLRRLLGSGKNRGELGDAIEALIAYSYLAKIFSIEEMISLLSDALKEVMLTTENEIEQCTVMFTKLVLILCSKFNL